MSDQNVVVVDIWSCDPNAELGEDARLEAWSSMMNDEERARHGRFVFEEHRHDFLVTRALVRVALSRYAPEIEPAAWRFSANSYGRPELASSHHAAAPGLRFNLSHTRGAIVFAVVTDGRDVGVDVEQLNTRTATLSVAKRFFAAAEFDALRSLPEAAQRRRFFELWTLKESYIKARGMGLSIPLGDFSFDLSGESLTVSLAPTQDDVASRWTFRQWSLGETHMAALAVADLDGAALEVRHRGAPWRPGERAISASQK